MGGLNKMMLGHRMPGVMMPFDATVALVWRCHYPMIVEHQRL